RQINIDSKSDRIEFLNDLTAMANANGGDIVFGIEDCKGKLEIKGLLIDNIDNLKLRIESILRDNVNPRLRYEIKLIKITEDRYLILIRVFESINSPHMVLCGGCGFYIRNQSGKHKMSVDELRECFMTRAGYSKDAYLFHLKDELEYNQDVMNNLSQYISDSPPLKNAFESANAGTLHFRLEAWNAIVRAGILPLLTFEQQKTFQDADKSIRNTARLIQMVNAEWKRDLESHEWDKKNNSSQLAPLKEVYKSKRHYIKELINKGVKSIEVAIKTFNL
ncbi:MAG: ATP-binding protein, partial [Anaerovorax sp.]|nr:ATP-binding protein [Anaerovorax sp.]